MTCAKKVVIAVIMYGDRVLGFGSNACASPQKACPRLPGEGYAKCQHVCGQPMHAEPAAIRDAKANGYEDLCGTRCRVFGIKHICEDCQEQLDAHGIIGELG